ncbi:MAG: YwqG family protein [Bacillus sp. (in: firmicutes)]
MASIDQLLEEHKLTHKKEEIIRRLSPAIGLGKVEIEEADIPVGASKFGGLPDLPPHLIFPQYEHGFLSFLAQMNLSEAKPFDSENLLPARGMLYFFYDAVEQPWGMDQEDEGCFRVLYYDGGLDALERTAYPEATEDYFPLPAFRMVFKAFRTLAEEGMEGEWEEADAKKYDEFKDALTQADSIEGEEGYPEPMHYMFGDPYNIQDNVFEEISYYEHREKLAWDAPGIKASVRNMVLLFQMDSDDDLEVMWGDVGVLYFCMDRDDLLNKRFDRVKFILQCC